MKKAIFSLSFRCHYANGNYTEHRQDMKLAEIPKWVEAYNSRIQNAQVSVSNYGLTISRNNKKFPVRKGGETFFEY